MTSKLFNAMPSRQFHPIKQQAGTVLVVSLIILLVITLLGVANMQTSTFQMKMASSNKERQTVFAIAEAGLREAEKLLEVSPPQRTQIFDSCSGGTCFNQSCNSGQCFSGEYPENAPTLDSDCSLWASSSYDASDPDADSTKFWSDTSLDVWDNSARHKTISVPGSSKNVKYILEFLCFGNQPPPEALVSAGGDGLPLFRITALAEGSDSRVRVVLQSIYSLDSSSAF